jgi:hypothetical protein
MAFKGVVPVPTSGSDDPGVQSI